MYNLRVAEYHTYFVGSQSWGFSVWAHNQYRTSGPTVPRNRAIRVTLDGNGITASGRSLSVGQAQRVLRRGGNLYARDRATARAIAGRGAVGPEIDLHIPTRSNALFALSPSGPRWWTRVLWQWSWWRMKDRAEYLQIAVEKRAVKDLQSFCALLYDYLLKNSDRQFLNRIRSLEFFCSEEGDFLYIDVYVGARPLIAFQQTKATRGVSGWVFLECLECCTSGPCRCRRDKASD